MNSAFSWECSLSSSYLAPWLIDQLLLSALTNVWSLHRCDASVLVLFARTEASISSSTHPVSLSLWHSWPLTRPLKSANQHSTMTRARSNLERSSISVAKLSLRLRWLGSDLGSKKASSEGSCSEGKLSFEGNEFVKKWGLNWSEEMNCDCEH